MSTFPSITIDKFKGLNLSKNQLEIQPGQLIKNENYLYMTNGGLEERGGGNKLSNAPSAGNPLYGLSNYINQNNSEFLITIQGTSAYYYSAGWNSLYGSLTSNKKNAICYGRS